MFSRKINVFLDDRRKLVFIVVKFVLWCLKKNLEHKTWGLLIRFRDDCYRYIAEILFKTYSHTNTHTHTTISNMCNVQGWHFQTMIVLSIFFCNYTHRISHRGPI